MKKYAFIWLLILINTSCVVKYNGDLGFALWFKVLFWIVIAVFIILLIRGNKEEKQTREILARDGLKQSHFTRVGRYIGGHPDQNNEILSMTVRDDGEDLDFYDHFGEVGMPKYKFAIPKESIINITMEDSSTMEKKITLGRVLLVGVFALAWKKNKKNEMAFVTINWKVDRFEHNTLFVHEGKNAMQKANTSRNHLIKLISSK